MNPRSNFPRRLDNDQRMATGAVGATPPTDPYLLDRAEVDFERWKRPRIAAFAASTGIELRQCDLVRMRRLRVDRLFERDVSPAFDQAADGTAR